VKPLWLLTITSTWNTRHFQLVVLIYAPVRAYLEIYGGVAWQS